MRVATIILCLLLSSLTQSVQAQSINGNAVSSRFGDACVSCQSSACRGNCGQVGCNWFANAEYLAIRPHFSEAVAFARGQQTPTSITTEAQKIKFDYDSSFRTTVGMMVSKDESFQATYSYLQGATGVGGTVSAPGEFIVDPFGNLVGAAAVVDPTDARFGTFVIGGDEIQTTSSINVNVLDIGYSKRLGDQCYSMQLDAGARIADVDQSYRSIITQGGAVFSDGQFSATFVGAGPRIGLKTTRLFGRNRRLMISASMHGSLLIGNHDSRFSNSVPLPFVGAQKNVQSRTLPVLDAEVAANWRMNDRLTFRTGWLFSSWFDLGVSGGTFGNFFAGSDDSSTMSFDGLFTGVEFSF